MEYNFKIHEFIPNKERDLELQNNIEHDIDVLGLNFMPLLQLRKERLNQLVIEIRYGKKTLEKARAMLLEYFTAFEMIVRTSKL